MAGSWAPEGRSATTLPLPILKSSPPLVSSPKLIANIDDLGSKKYNMSSNVSFDSATMHPEHFDIHAADRLGFVKNEWSWLSQFLTQGGSTFSLIEKKR